MGFPLRYLRLHMAQRFDLYFETKRKSIDVRERKHAT